MLGTGQASHFRGAKAKGPRAGVGFCKLLESGSAVSSPKGSRAEPRPLKGFLAFWRRQKASPGTCWRLSSGWGACMPPLLPTLNPPMHHTDTRRHYTCTLSPLEKCAVVSTCASHPSFDLMTSGSTHAYYSACHGLATDLVFIAQVVYLLEHKRLKIHMQQQLKKNGKETENAKKHGDFGRKMEKSIYVYTHTHTHV